MPKQGAPFLGDGVGRTEESGRIGAFSHGDLAEHKSEPEQAAQQEHFGTPLTLA
ncbi:hypothetical protein [Rhodoblastus sp.]|uniref:hypothetical protein n=1 Tax=Rhodoblastus sp. TaxID=1962975 RepID=UPI00261E8E4D|nr:hypothetical protein [Rhodoblastus sp.]